MTKRLYEVRCEVTLMVVAESDADAESLAQDVVSVKDDGAAVEAYARPARVVPEDWRGCLPFGGEDEKHADCEAWLAMGDD